MSSDTHYHAAARCDACIAEGVRAERERILSITNAMKPHATQDTLDVLADLEWAIRGGEA